MADQEYIKKAVEAIAKRFGKLQEETIEAVLKLVEGKTSTEALAVINNLNIQEVMKAKGAGIVSSYVAANRNVLLGKRLFAPITEADLTALLIQSQQYLSGEISNMGNILKQEIIGGAINKRTVDQIAASIAKKGYAPGVGIKRIINDGLNDYSRAVSRMMMDKAPKDAKYIYIGPADEKTRDFCLSAIQLGPVTLEQINSAGSEYVNSLTKGGGPNCRHGWELASTDVRDQYYRKEEAEEIINAG